MVDRITDKEKAERYDKALKLVNDIFDIHTNNTERDIAYRNATRMFYSVLTKESVEFEEFIPF